RSHRPHRRRLRLESDGWRLRQGRAVPAPRHRRGAAPPHRSGPDWGRRPPFRVIDALLELARRRVDGGRRGGGGGADALERRVERTALAFEAGRLKAAGVTEEAGVNVRVLHRGRVGIAGTTNVGVGEVGAQHAAPLLERALASAELGEALALGSPSAAQPPRLDHALRIVAPPEGALPVVFTPAGLSAVLLPVTQGLSGKAVLQGISPLAHRVGEQVFDEGVSLTDDPLAPGRTASRPLDDE